MIIIPTCPRAESYTAQLVPQPAEQRSASGGSLQRHMPLDQRWLFTVQMPSMYYADARKFAPLDVGDDECRWMIPKLGESFGDPGSPVVDGSGYLGVFLPLRGLEPGHEIGTGRWLRFEAGGRRWLHRARGPVTANGSGVAIVPVAPKLRYPPSDGAAVEMVAVSVDGFVTLTGLPQHPPRSGIVSGLTFTIEERG